VKLYGVWMTEDGLQIGEFENADELLKMFEDDERHPNFVPLGEIDEQSDADDIALIRGQAFVPKPKKVVKAWDFDK
jgi:hypothetical protein